ncbi:MAG: hydroxyacid dehydrogenase, partial [Thermomicrobiales bacterium]
MTLPKVAVLIPDPMRARILDAAAESRLAGFAEIISAADGKPTSADLPTLLEGVQAVISGWGTPSLTEEILATNPSLGLVAHTAGSIHKLVPAEAVEGGFRVTHAAAIIADAVAELVIGQTLRHLRALDQMDDRMKTGTGWLEIRHDHPGRLLGEQTVGIVGTGHVGRTVISRFQAFGATMLVSDPFLSEEKATELGVTKVELDDIFAKSDIVSLHAPALPDTIGIVDRRRLAMLRDGALLINMSRGALVKENELYEELLKNRIFAVLDVFAQEPLEAESPLRKLNNIFLSPHAAGQTVDTYLRQGRAMVDEVERFLNGDALKYEISAAALATMA